MIDIDTLLEEESVWEYFARTEKPIALYGTGNGADKIVDAFLQRGIPLAAVFASDGFVRKRSFRGFPVLSLAEVEQRFSDFVVAIGFGSSRSEVLAQIRTLEKRHETRVPCVPVCGATLFDRRFIEENRQAIEDTFYLLEDEQSKIVYQNFLRFQLTGKLPYLWASDSEKEEAFHCILRLGAQESYLDLGAYRGDTVEEFLHFTNGQYASVTAVEPNQKSFERLTAFCASLENAQCIHAAVGARDGMLNFDGDGRHNAASKSGKQTVRCVTVDALAEKTKFSYVKADIEGLECEMLEGAKETLKNQKPKLNIAVYHKSRDIFTIPRLIQAYHPDYKIYLRKHPYVPFWDLNLYCVSCASRMENTQPQ